LLGRPVAVTKLRGKVVARPDGRAVLVTLHPSALLRGPPETRQLAWHAWLRDLARAAPGGA
jgi:DNA polymerase